MFWADYKWKVTSERGGVYRGRQLADADRVFQPFRTGGNLSQERCPLAGTSIVLCGYSGTLPARRSEPYSCYYRYKWPPGKCLQVLKEPLTEVPPLFQAQDTGCSAQYTGTLASVSSCAKWDVRCVNRSLKGFFQRHSSLCSIEKPCHKLRPRELPILNFIYRLLNYFMNRALCSMPGILPCASFSLYKPLGLALICVPRVPSLKMYMPGEGKREIKAQSEFTCANLSRHW